MVGGRRVCAATTVAAAFFVWSCVSAGTARADADESRRIVFSGRDVWRHSVFAHGGLLLAPGGFAQDGLMLKLLLSTGAYRYHAQNLGRAVTGYEGKAQLLPGWRIKRGNAEMKFFFGPEFQYHYLSPDDPDNRLRGRSFGLRVATELWYEPTRTTLVAGDASLTSIGASHSVRLALGMLVFGEMIDALYVGPETQVFGADGYRQIRFGAHITSMKTAETEWSAGIGWAHDSDGRSSPYLRISVMARR
ncbi:MAG: cellulose biosynthesis protein BcsS [Pseudolabrys sp.]|nr:cellulose biosynthesis protein BcsS [Pseudolabrys sp.]